MYGVCSLSIDVRLREVEFREREGQGDREKRGAGALFIIAKTWKQPKGPSIDEWIKKMWYIYAMEYYSAMKKNETRTSLVVQWLRL